MNKYRFDSGFDNNLSYDNKKNEKYFDSINDNNLSYDNKENEKYFDSINDNINSNYYPCYLNNPLNKNVGGTEIQAIRQKSNYEQDRQEQILTEKNNPSPVMLGNEWSEWASIQE